MHLRQALQSAESAGAIAIDSFWNSAVKDDLSFSLFLRWHTFSDRRDITIDRSQKGIDEYRDRLLLLQGIGIACNFTIGSFVRKFRQRVKCSSRGALSHKSRESNIEEYSNRKC